MHSFARPPLRRGRDRGLWFQRGRGRASAAELWAPSAVTVDAAGDLLIADEGNSAVREVPAVAGTFYGVTIGAGDIATVAGQDQYTTYLNDGLAATGPVADVNYPTGLAVDGAGDLFIADSYDESIREVPAHSGVVFGRSVDADDMYTLVGVLAVGGAAAGDGTRWVLTHVTYPYGVALDPSDLSTSVTRAPTACAGSRRRDGGGAENGGSGPFGPTDVPGQQRPGLGRRGRGISAVSRLAPATPPAQLAASDPGRPGAPLGLTVNGVESPVGVDPDDVTSPGS